MDEQVLPSIEEILFAMSEQPLGEGAEAKVFKIHTNPKYTVRVSLECPPLSVLSEIINNNPRINQKNIFGNRNFAQALAYWKNPQNPSEPLLTINLYCPGISIEVEKPGRPKPDAEEALIRTRVLSETILNLPDAAFDQIYDDLHFLSSRKHSIDVGGDLFTNTGNILYSAVDNRMFIIDLQPFIQRPGLPQNQKKGFNTPLYLARGLLPGAFCYQHEHSKDPDLIKYRTEIVERVIAGAERNHLNDVGGYLKGDISQMAAYWRRQITLLNIPEQYHENMIKRISQIQDEPRYYIIKDVINYVRVSGNSL